MIGIFDSGIGGLTVVREIIKRFPHVSLIYFGDTARLPYGEKDPETITKYAIENCSFLIEQGAKVIVVACHTASAIALERLREEFEIPIFGMIGPIILENVSRIAILATEATIQSGVYQEMIIRKNPEAQILPIACPQFVPMIENGIVDREVVHQTLLPVIDAQIETIFLGCTHYPILSDLIQEFVGTDVQLIDSTKECVESLSPFIQNETGGQRQYFVSESPEKF